jgi:hypothetical protein
MNIPKSHHCVLAVLLGFALLFSQAQALPESADELLKRHAELHEKLLNNPFERPLVVESSDQDGRLKGEIFARLEQPFAVAAPRLKTMAEWCDVLILHLNVKSCLPSSVNSVDTLTLNIGRKFDQPLEDTYPFGFLYQVKSDQPNFLQVLLTAEEGPVGTGDYNIELQLVALDEQRSFLHLSYAYSYGLASKTSMNGYLATIGRDKVGFSITGNDSDGQPIYQDGVRGVIERNTMRYYLALEAYLGASTGTPAEQQEQRLNDWYSATERYPRQLHEIERSEYLAMKHAEIRRQQTPVNDQTPPEER